MSEHCALVLDDWHHIRDRSVLDAMVCLLLHQPSRLRLAIVCRFDPPLPIARLRVRYDVTEIRAESLRFEAADSQAFLERTTSRSLDGKLSMALHERTEGWPAGLRPGARVAMRTQNTELTLERFSGTQRHLAGYLAEEVYAGQPQDVRTFCRLTSVLGRFSAALCKAVLGRGDCQQMLDALQRGDLFLVPLDDQQQWFRYHHLRHEYLNRLSTESEEQRIHRDAARWYESRGQMAEAVEQIMATDDEDARIRLVQLAAKSAWESEDFLTLSWWRGAIPEHIVRNNWGLCMPKCWALSVTGNCAAAQAYAAAAKDLLPEDASPVQAGGAQPL